MPSHGVSDSFCFFSIHDKTKKLLMVVNIDFHISFEESFSTQIFVASRILYQAPQYDSCIEQIANPQEHLCTRCLDKHFFSRSFPLNHKLVLFQHFGRHMWQVDTFPHTALQLPSTFSTGNPGTFI